MLSLFVRILCASTMTCFTLVACGGTASIFSTTTADGSQSIRWRAVPDHTVHYIPLFPYVPSVYCCTLAVDPQLNLVYIGSGANVNGSNTFVLNGSSLKIIRRIKKFGGAGNVDSSTHNVWLPGLYAQNVAVYSAIKRSIISKVLLGDCPVGSWVDAKRRYAWVAAQCGHNNDPVWVVNADTFDIVAGPISTPGVMGPNIVNPATGKFYVAKNAGGNFEINPHTFQASPTSFGTVIGVDARSDLLYAFVTNGLNIVDGRSEKIVKTLRLSYTPAFVGVNPSLGHIYLSEGQGFIEVREESSGALLKRVGVRPGYDVVSLGADRNSGRIYAAVKSTSNFYLLYVKD